MAHRNAQGTSAQRSTMQMKPIHPLSRFFVSLIVVVLMSMCSSTTSHPSDAVLEQRLRSHQADFDNLVRMFVEDSDIVQITHKNVFFDNSPVRNLPQGRLDEYRSLFQTLQLEGGIKRERGHLLLIASTKGTVIPNSGKTYLYSDTEPFPLVESLDAVITSHKGDQPPIYKKLFDKWYLSYESW